MTTLLASVNDRRVTRLSVRVPWCGTWTAEVDFDESIPSDKLAGQARVQIGHLTLLGTLDPLLTGTYLAQSKAFVVGGAGGWARTVARKTYHDDGLGIKARTVIEDIARDAGETLGACAPARERLGSDWERREGAASSALVLAAGSVPWFVGYDGVTQVGRRATADAGTCEILDVDPRFRTVEIAAEDPSAVMVGSILRGRLAKPMTVRELVIDVADGRVRLLAWGADGGLDTYVERSRLLRDLQAVARAAMPELPYSRIYRYRVVKANPGDHRWELQAVSKAQRLPDIAPASVHPGIAGAVAKLSPGAVVLVQFVEADPSMPVITHFEAADGAGFVPIELALCAGRTGTQPTEHATSAEALVSMFDAFCTAINVSIPGVVTGAGLVAAKAAIINAAIPLTCTVPITPYAAALAAALVAKLPNTSGDLPGPGWPSVRGG
jgi:hypothetical protein